jgi:hypothetical protein
MSDMGIGHDEVTIPKDGLAIAKGGATVYGHELPDNIVIPNHNIGLLTTIAQVLRRGS